MSPLILALPAALADRSFLLWLPVWGADVRDQRLPPAVPGRPILATEVAR